MSHRQYLIQSSDIQNLNARLISVALSKDEMDWHSTFHTHHFTELFFVVNGKGSFLFREESYPIQEGDFVVIPPYVEHTEQSIPGTSLEYYVIGVDGLSFHSDGRQPGVQLFMSFRNDPFIASIFSQMLYEMKQDKYGSEQICQNLLEILILRMIRRENIVPIVMDSARITKECAHIKEYLDTNYAETITLDSLTRLTHMNKYYLVHSFTKYTGYSPIQYLNMCRMRMACSLLTTSDFSISSIASLVGFSSQSYFAQAFRKSYGISPIKYRKEHTTQKS
ncbi:MAG: AraC family transcriptional regulator [Clostridiales bacterium]|nr:AraC family transcriptional regulator [Clostridiales bacterium]